MAHNLDFTTGRAGIAFMGDRANIWHRMGQQMQPGQTIEEWIKAAGLDWQAHMVPAIANLAGPDFDHMPAGERFRDTGEKFIVRGDTGGILNARQTASDGYQLVQPRELFDWFDRYIAVDDRFQLDVAGSLRGGSLIWATATFNGGMDVAGEQHQARLLMTTTYDLSGATVNKGTTVRVVCNNTLDAALADGSKAVIKTRHSTRFNPERVGKELAAVAQSFATFKRIGDAMAQVEMAKNEVSNFFKEILEIPFDAKAVDVSTRKMNQFSDLSRAYSVTKRERNTERDDVWSALQAVTRYVDHDRSARDTDGAGEEIARFASAQFGSGAGLKVIAWNALLPRVRELVPVAA